MTEVENSCSTRTATGEGHCKPNYLDLAEDNDRRLTDEEFGEEFLAGLPDVLTLAGPAAAPPAALERPKPLPLPALEEHDLERKTVLVGHAPLPPPPALPLVPLFPPLVMADGRALDVPQPEGASLAFLVDDGLDSDIASLALEFTNARLLDEVVSLTFCCCCNV